MEFLESAMHLLVKVSIVVLELIGVGVLLSAAVRSLFHYVKKDPEVRLLLALGIALALEFKLGGEVLRTVIVRQWSELLILGAVILLRAALTFLIHWEIQGEEKQR